MSRLARCLSFFVASILIVNPIRPQTDDVSELVAPLAKKAPHSRKMVVLPLLSASSDRTLGVFLAKQISATLAARVGGLETLDASSATLPIESGGNPPHPVYGRDALNKFAKDAGADLVVEGNFASYEDGLGVSLAMFKTGQKMLLATSSGKVQLTEEIKRFPAPAPTPGSSPDGIYLAGWGGVGMPRCHSCPDPHFPAGESGYALVNLSVVVGTDGRSHDIQIVKSPTSSFAAAAIEAVKKWKFDSAKGPDGKPVAARVPVEILFRSGPN